MQKLRAWRLIEDAEGRSGMKRRIWRSVALMVFTLLITAGYGMLAFHTAAYADEPPAPTVTPEPLQTIVIDVDPTPEPERVSRPQPVIYDYQIGKGHVETVARAMYGLDTTKEKLTFAFLVVNRLFCAEMRGDGQRLFPQDITEVVEQAGEFEFYDPNAPVTKENLGLAELGLDIQMTAILTKEYTGYAFPSSLIYMGWENGEVAFYTERRGDAWRIER